MREAHLWGLHNVHAEATPHHFSLTENDVITHGALAKMNPPLRTEADRKAIIEGLADGTIEIIATDHAPHTEAEKAAGLKAAPSGVIGLETALALGITQLVQPGYLSMTQLIERMSTWPAKIYGLNAGVLEEWSAADIVIFDPQKRWTVSDNFASKAKNSPFIGWELFGKVKYTICNGQIVYSDQQ